MSARGVTLGLALAVVLVVGARGAGEEVDPHVLRLVWLDVTGVAVGVDGVARAECRSILKRAGIDVWWRRGSGGEEARPDEVRVILVDQMVVDPVRRCSILGATPARSRQHPLIWIHVGSVRAALGLSPGFPIPDLPLRVRRDVGVALGRIAAHEVVHVLAPWLEHGHGVMSPMLTVDDLTAARLSLEPRTVHVVLDALRGRPVPPRSAFGLLAASAAINDGVPAP